MQPYLSFADGWGHTAMFDDPEMERALRKFQSIASDFYSDAAVESAHPHDADPASRFAVLIEHTRRPAYSPEWTATRQRLIDKAQTTAAACDALYILGRERGY